MKNLMLMTFTLFSFSIASAQNASNPNAQTIRKTFSRTTTVSTEINADAAIVWAMLTNAADFPRWNSTVIRIEGEIIPGKTIRLTSVLDPKRTFKLKVKKFVPEQTLIWGDPMGKRTYTLLPNGKDKVIFQMTEKIGGPIFPLFANKIPSFDASFNQFAADLKKEAEIIQQGK